MKGIIHRCIDFNMRKFEPVYAQRYTVRPGTEKNGTHTEKRRSFTRIGFLCEKCGFHFADRAGQVPRHSDAERLLIAFAMSQDDTLEELRDLAGELGIQLAASELNVQEDKDHDG